MGKPQQKPNSRILLPDQRPFRDGTDISLLMELVGKMPLSARQVIDLPRRLGTPGIHEGSNAVLWLDDDGRAVAFAAWQFSWAVLDFFILPGLQQHAVADDLFVWADERFRALDQERGKPLPYWVTFRDDDVERHQLVKEHGFLFGESDCYVLLQHPLQDILPTPVLPAGFTLRSLAGVRETSAYAELHRAAFESTSMTADWRARVIGMPQYRSELDLVIVAPDGTLVGFCVGWFSPEHQVAQIEPFGVHPRFQRLGLGRVLLLEILRRFQVQGATNAFVETNIERSSARGAYQAVGFQQIHTIRHIGKWMVRSV